MVELASLDAVFECVSKSSRIYQNKPHTSRYLSVRYFRELHKKLPARSSVIFDAEDAPDIALQALEQGMRFVLFTGSEVSAKKLSDIAAQRGSVVAASQKLLIQSIIKSNKGERT